MTIAYQETSREAWQQCVKGELDRAICAALEGAGTAGLIDEEIEGRIKRDHQSVSGNRRHLVERGLVRKTCLCGVTTRGKKAIRWVLSKYYDPAIHSSEDEPWIPKPETRTQSTLF